jgi:hypothetical protein
MLAKHRARRWPDIDDHIVCRIERRGWWLRRWRSGTRTWRPEGVLERGRSRRRNWENSLCHGVGVGYRSRLLGSRRRSCHANIG